ncbi:MAG: PAS domain S-box protein, partial [Deltaproteobacteria bacterium]|nr:PAS domain S-box protein [Deltaproteobacteria bacterium]
MTDEVKGMLDFRDLLDQVPDGIGINRGKKLIHVNKVLLDILGYDDPVELIGKPWTLIVHPDDAEKATEQFQDVMEHGGRSPFQEIDCVRKDGSVVTLEVAAFRVSFDGEPVTVGITRDMSERKELMAWMMKMDR